MLTIATYNIQFSQHPQQIIKNVSAMANMGVSLFCLQEVVFYDDQTFIIDLLLEKLGSDWKAIYHLGSEKSELGMGNCILWNSKVLDLQKEQKELLPKSKNLAVHEKIFSWIAGGITVPFQRRVIIGYFKFGNTLIRVTNVHLDHNGGLKNRRKQLLHLMSILSKNPIHQEIICGDFNSLDPLKTGKEVTMQKEVLGESFIDASKKSGWTADLNNIDLVNGPIFSKLLKMMDIHVKRKIDFIWVRNMKSIDCKKLLLKGSDHCPVVVELDV